MGSGIQFHVWSDAASNIPVQCQAVQIIRLSPRIKGCSGPFHQTLKNMMRAYCMEHGNDWDQSIYLLLFATREAAQELLDFSPFKFIFGHTVRKLLKLLKQSWLAEDTPDNLLE